MAAGVGKTYRMLGEGLLEADEGRDVVVGYLEDHGRRETAAQATGLDVFPRRLLTHRGVTLEEMDLPGLLNRRPSSAWSTSWPTPTRPAPSTTSAIRTSARCWRPAWTCSRP